MMDDVMMDDVPLALVVHGILLGASPIGPMMMARAGGMQAIGVVAGTGPGPGTGTARVVTTTAIPGPGPANIAFLESSFSRISTIAGLLAGR